MENQQESPILYNHIREKFVLPVRLWLYRYTRRLLIIFILALLANFMFSYFFYTPKMYKLRKENNEIVSKYKLLDAKISLAYEQLKEIKSRDRAVYRSIFSLDTLDVKGVWTPYPDSKYADATYARYTPLMQDSWHRMDALTRQIYAQSLSLDQIEKLSLDKDMMAECIPAIWPINKKQLRGHIGAFGGRYHPRGGSWQQHKGIDLAGNYGTPIYATAMGTVMPSDNGWGYGNQIMINHGFGYKTRYAHLSKILVSPGQVVKRGEKIGEMGSTGNSTGTHLHYEVLYRGLPMNPINYFSRDMNEKEFKEIIDRAKEINYEAKE